jgi:hypothetical protein
LAGGGGVTGGGVTGGGVTGGGVTGGGVTGGGVFGGGVDARVTVTTNAGSHATFFPSETRIEMLRYVPRLSVCGVPCSAPVFASNVAHGGRFLMKKVSELPSGSLAVGTKRYALPVATDAAGAPEITGA